ncbi:MAG: hypothetical protein ACFBWO_05190 [Paracoccaceae bacterium]
MTRFPLARFLLTWAGAFGGVLAILVALEPLIAPWPLWARALALSGLMVALMQRLVAPAVERLVRRP